MDPNICSIRIYSPEFDLLAETQTAESVQFIREWQTAGHFEIHISLDKPGAEALSQRDNIIIINRDPYRSGIIRDVSITENRNKKGLVIYGETAEGFCRQRLTVPPSETQVPGSMGWDRIIAPAESMLKHYAARNMTAPFDANRIFERLIIAPDEGRGMQFPWQTRYHNLLSGLSLIAEFGDTGFGIYADLPNRQWVFDVITGTDRTRGQTDVSPVTFKMEYANLAEYRYSEDFQQYRNTGYAGGMGENESRLFYIIGASNTGRNRFEEFLDCGNIVNVDDLIYYGTQKMAGMSERKTLEADILPRSFVFGEDYFLGDKVTVIITRLGITIDTRVSMVREIWERNTGYKTEIRFGQRLPNAFSLIRQNQNEEVR
jgi:hypothetical protein